MSVGVFITGASGHVGRALAGQLVASRFVVRGLDQRPGRWTDTVGDLRSAPLTRLLNGSDVVVHCASLHAPHVDRVNASAFVEANVLATARLLTAAEQAGVSKFIFTSTTSVYGHAFEDPDQAAWVDESLVDESLAPSPRDVYDTTKLEAESLVRMHHGPALRTMTLRIARCFPEPWPTSVVNRLYRGVDLRDVVSALELAIGAPPLDHQVLNIAGPRVFERSDVQHLRTDPVSVITARLPWLAAEFSSRDWQLPTSIDGVYVSDRAASVLNYRPARGVRDALNTQPPGADRPPPLPRAC